MIEKKEWGKHMSAIIRHHQLFACPICHNAFHVQGNSLVCADRHCFDISKYGTVHFMQQNKLSKEYSKESFQSRRYVLENGLYTPVLEMIQQLCERFSVQSVLDVGCGEGFYAKSLARVSSVKEVIAFDISKSSIQLAAKQDKEHAVAWCVADLGNIPVLDETIDAIVNVYSPANYEAFKRIINENGVIIKVIPNEHHLKEVREIALKDHVKKEYKNDKIVKLFTEHFDVIETIDVAKTYPLTDQLKQAVLDMTPLLFHKKMDEDMLAAFNEVTIAGTILVGKKKLD